MNLISQNEDVREILEAINKKSSDGSSVLSTYQPALLNENLSNDFLEDILQAQLGNNFNKFKLDHRIIKLKEKAAAEDENKCETKELISAEQLREERNRSTFL